MATTLVPEERAEAVTLPEMRSWLRRVDGRRPEEVLGVEPGTDTAATRAAYMSLARRFHPDAASRGDAELRVLVQEAFIRITAAYRSLNDGGRHAPAGGTTADRILARPAPAQAAPHLPPEPVPAAPRHPASRAGAASHEVALPAPAPDPIARSERVAEAMRLAAGSMADKDPQGAVSVLHEVLALATKDEKRRVRLLLAHAYLSEPTWRRYGLRLLDEMVAHDPADADALALLGGFYCSQGLFARAEATLRRALAADPGHAEARTHLRTVADHLDRRGTPAPSRASGRGLVARLLSRRR